VSEGGSKEPGKRKCRAKQGADEENTRRDDASAALMHDDGAYDRKFCAVLKLRREFDAFASAENFFTSDSHAKLGALGADSF
jgi:hypothetical protein